MKYLIVLALLCIVAALALAGRFMLKNGDSAQRGPNMARALAIRVGVSIALFLFILLAYKLGWIQPTGVPLGR